MNNENGIIEADGLTVLPESEWPESVSPESKCPGVDEFIHNVGLDNLDALSLTEVIEIAFLGGRTYEAKRDIETIKSLNVAATRKQAG